MDADYSEARAVTAYPQVLGEVDTLERVVTGASLARYGDGEFTLCRGHGIPCQPFHVELQRRLRDILRESGECLVGIPNLRSKTPKAEFWSQYASAASLLGERAYASAFITRPDSAPWIDTSSYWTALASLWIDQDVTLVRGSERSLVAEDLIGAKRITEIVCPKVDAWAEYESILARVGTPKRVLLCLGPTATVLAVDLCARGVQAVDLGHAGMWLRKHLRGEPMVRTEADKVSG